MLFRPSFCAHCGERIERAEWRIWTSRRFCAVCESEFKGQDLIPRFIVTVGVLIGIFGFGSYMKSGPATELSTVRQPQRFVEKQAAPPPKIVNNVPAGAPEATPVTGNTQVPAMPTLSPYNPPTQAPVAKPRVEQAEPVYYCGAETKKGTPCSRRVKGNTRCYQHVGMPSMLTAEKLKIK